MKRTKTQKGITLVALIITIIVLLILAVVTIGAIQNDGIIKYAQNAKDNYAVAQVEESKILENSLNLMNQYAGSGETSIVKTLDILGFGEISYEEGMTWEEWCESEYNTYSFYLNAVGWVLREDKVYKIIR